MIKSISTQILIRGMGAFLALLIFTGLAVIYINSPKAPPFDNTISILEDWEISLNQSDEWERIELPYNIATKQGDRVTARRVLGEPIPDGAVIFFKSNDTAVTVRIDSDEIYSTDYDGKYIGKVWHFIKPPDYCAGKTIYITQERVLKENAILMPLLEVGLGNDMAALFEYFNKNHLFFFYASTVLGLISLGTLIFSLYVIRKNKQIKNLFYISAAFVMIALWSVCENPITQLYFSEMYLQKPYLLTHMSFIFGLLFTVPMLIYSGEYCERKKIFERLAVITLFIISVLCIIDLLSISTLAESIVIIIALRTINLAAILISMVINAVKNWRKESKLIIIRDIPMCLIGIYEVIRLVFFGKQSISTLVYIGMAFVLFTRIIDAFVSYLQAYENYKLAQIHNDEILRSVEIQQDHYKKLSNQITVTRRMSHDFRQFQIMLYGALQQGTPEKTQELFEQIDTLYKDMRVQTYCDNMEVNSLISYAEENCKKHVIEFIHLIQLPDVINTVPIYDLCIVIGNLLDNAIEAALQCDETFGKRRVEIKAVIHKSNLIVSVENTYSGNLVPEGSVFKSTKENAEQHGFGVSIVQKIMENTNGELKIQAFDHKFAVTAIWGEPKSEDR